MPLSRGAISYHGLLFDIDAIRYISNIKNLSGSVSQILD